jgi:hypothetical protein
MWLNFSEFGGEAMYHYWPVILLSITAVILILPLPILYFRSRQWILYSMVSHAVVYCQSALLTLLSGAYFLLDCIPWNSETSTLGICSAHLPTLWE